MFEHIFHIFGGGCGEHLIWPALMGIFGGLLSPIVYWRHRIAQSRWFYRLTMWKRERFGPSTPPEHR